MTPKGESHLCFCRKTNSSLSYFSQKTGFDIPCKLPPFEKVCMKCQTCFLGKIRKYFICLLLKILPRVLSFNHQSQQLIKNLPASVAQLDAPSNWRPGGRGFNPRRGRQHSFVEIDHEIFSTVILSLPLIQEGQLSVSGERMCTILVNRLED